MQIHELNHFGGSLGAGAFVAVDDGNDTGKASVAELVAGVNADIEELDQTLNGRIDNIIAGGTAPSAAEVTDARYGGNGVTYASLGDAIRGQYNVLHTALSETDEALSSLSIIKHKINYISGGYIPNNYAPGTVIGQTPIVDANYEYAIISCSPGDRIEVNAKGLQGTRAWAFLDIENKLINLAATGIIEATVTAPANAAKVVLNNKKSEYTSDSYILTGEDGFSVAKNAINDASEYVIQDVTLTRGFYSYSGSPSHKTFTSLDYYESASVDCQPGDKFSISGYVLNNTSDIGYFWDENDNLISSIGTSDVNEYTDKIIEIPIGCVNFTVTSYRNGNVSHTIIKKWLIVGVESEKTKHPLIGKKFISFGDSITAYAPRWREQFIKDTGAEEIICYAVGGATLVDWADTILDGNIVDGPQNTVCNQVALFLQDPPATAPDFVVISAGTNDSWSADDLSRTTNTQFVNSSDQWISLDDVDRTRPDGAMRWQAEKIWSVYPDTVIIFGAPIQCAESIHRFRLQQQKNDRMKIVGNQLSCKVIMGAYDSGIYGRYETSGVDGKYLIDGIHPNAAGGIVLGKLYAREITALLRY